jgi:dynein heavy chain
VNHIQALPLIAAPEVFGLHDNADITKDLQESQALLDGLLTAQKTSESSSTSSSSGSGAVKSTEAVIGEVAADILARLPGVFDIEAAEAAYPQDYYNSMNTVLVQVGRGSLEDVIPGEMMVARGQNVPRLIALQ